MKDKKQMIKNHQKRMYHLRVNNEDWQLIHQKRWGEDSLCWEDKCDCEEIYYKKKGMLFFDGTKST